MIIRGIKYKANTSRNWSHWMTLVYLDGARARTYLRSVIHDGCRLLAAINGFLINMFTDSKRFYLKSSLTRSHARALRAAQQDRSACLFMCNFALLKYLVICCSEHRVCWFCGFIETVEHIFVNQPTSTKIRPAWLSVWETLIFYFCLINVIAVVRFCDARL